ncbi:MAG: TraR/DksA C4-type zinc finger protein [Actinomycetota bacterium]|nr:TraR/DksA C4-type zinc finger protein [Actinomycetota bacterium]
MSEDAATSSPVSDSPAPDSPLRAEAALAGIEQRLAEVAGALGRLDDGTYGRCDACGAPIGEPLLALAPLARRCERCEKR